MPVRQYQPDVKMGDPSFIQSLTQKRLCFAFGKAARPWFIGNCPQRARQVSGTFIWPSCIEPIRLFKRKDQTDKVISFCFLTTQGHTRQTSWKLSSWTSNEGFGHTHQALQAVTSTDFHLSYYWGIAFITLLLRIQNAPWRLSKQNPLHSSETACVIWLKGGRKPWTIMRVHNRITKYHKKK